MQTCEIQLSFNTFIAYLGGAGSLWVIKPSDAMEWMRAISRRIVTAPISSS